MMKIFEMDDLDITEFETVANYLEGKYNDLGRPKKDRVTKDNPKQLLQMSNTIRRALALASRVD